MVIGLLLTGIVTGLAASTVGLFFGSPLWLAILLYPVAGTCGVMGFVGFALTRKEIGEDTASTIFASEFR